MERNITPDQVRPFNIEFAKREAPVGTKSGRVVCLHSFDNNEVRGHFIMKGLHHPVEEWSKDGVHVGDDRSLDIFMHPCGAIDGLDIFFDTKIERRIPMTDNFEVVTAGEPAYKDGPAHTDLISANGGIHWNGTLIYRRIGGVPGRPLEECDDLEVRSGNSKESLELIKAKVIAAITEKMADGDKSGVVAIELPRELGQILERMGVGMSFALPDGMNADAVLESIERQTDKKNLH